MISDYLILAIRNIRKRKVRSWLTMLGIFISIATIFMLVSISLGLQGAVQEQFRLLGSDKFFIQPKGQIAGPGSGGAVLLTTNDVDRIEKLSGVKEVSFDAIGNAEVESDKQKRFVLAVGIPLDKLDVFNEVAIFDPDEGRVLEKGDLGKVMIGSQYKYNSFFSKSLKTGDKILINRVEFKIKSILKTRGNPGDDRAIYMSLDDFKTIFNSGDRVDQIIVQVNPGVDVKEIANKTEKDLRKFRQVTEKTQDFSISTPEELLASFGTILNIITAFLLGVAAISLLVGGIGIANTMYTSVLERTKEIGVMKAVGAQNKDILYIFLIESSLLGLLGGIIGVILGILGSKSLEYIAIHNLGTNLLQAAIPTYLVIGCLLFSSVIGGLSGVLPAYNATRVKPVTALRYE